MSYILLFMMLGLAVGTLSGVLGLGGGVIIVPALVMIFQHKGYSPEINMHLAVGTALASIVITTASTSWYQYRQQAIVWRIWRRLLPGLLLGVMLGVFIADFMDARSLQRSFACILVLLGLESLRPNVNHSFGFVSAPVYFVVGIVVGSISGMFGVGGGLMLVPLLQYFSVPIVLATATSTACLWPTSVVGAIFQVFSGLNEPDLPMYAIGHVYWPAALVIGLTSILSVKMGVHLSHTLSVPILRRMFSILLFLAALKMWF